MMKRINPKRTHKQDKQRKLCMEPLEVRLCLAASLGWDGPGLGAASLSYYIGDVPASVGLPQAEVETAIETALDVWAQVADVTFTQTTLARQSDSLDITFSSIDGSGGILAQAYLPDDVNRGRLAGDIEFDLADPWEIGNADGSAAFDLVYVAAHEIGHALGLDHLNVAGSVLRPTVSPSQAFTSLSTVDMNSILGLYAAAPGDTTDTGGTGTGSTDTGGTATGGTATGDQGDDTTDDGSSSGGNNTGGEELPRGRGRHWHYWGRFGRFGGGRGRTGSARVEVLTAGSAHQNSELPGDVNNDRTVSALDALMIINYLNQYGPRDLSLGEGEADSSSSMLDVSGDENVTALDALMVINELNNEKPVVIAIEEPVDEGTVTETDTTTDTVDTDATDETDSGQEVDNTGAVDNETSEESEEKGDDVDDTSVDDGAGSEEQTDNEPDDDTTVDDGPLEEEHERCRHEDRDPFARFDANEDGLLTVDEVPEMLWARLLAADADEDRAISPAELEAIAREHHRGDPFAAFDANQDGALTVDEVPARLWNRLSQADADEDGAVTADEFAQLRTQPEEGHAHRSRRGEVHRRHAHR